MMIRLGHIDYSNCIPVHALLLEAGHEDVRLVHGVPTQLNDALACGDIDVAPCSSIEYARHAGAYRILPGFAIGSAGPVRSILLETTRPVAALGGTTIAVPSASATSIVLLRILLELRSGVRARLEAFDQAAAVDPVEHGAAAVLRIGDVALARRVPAGRSIIDLGALWYEWTGLPFAFAVWQVRAGVAPADTTRLLQLLTRSRAWFHEHERELAQRHAPGFGLEPDTLLDYWRSLHFDLDAPMRRGLLHFFGLAAELGAAPPTTSLDIIAA